MKSIRNLLTATLAAGALSMAATGMSFAGAADDAAGTQPPPPPGHPGRNHQGEPWHLLGKLDLNAAQKRQIKEIMTAGRPQLQSLREQMQANSLKLWQTQPSDPNYASLASQVSQPHGSPSAPMMTHRPAPRARALKGVTPPRQPPLTRPQAH